MRTILRPDDGVETRAFHTQPVELGNCFFPNIDNTREVLEEAERRFDGLCCLNPLP